MLLNESLSAVDVEFAPALRSLLRSVLVNRLAVIVTHQVIDALVLARRVVVLEGGRVREQGPAHQVPRLNLISGTATAGGLRAADGIALTGSTEFTVPGAGRCVQPRRAGRVRGSAQGGPRNVI